MIADLKIEKNKFCSYVLLIMVVMETATGNTYLNEYNSSINRFAFALELMVCLCMIGIDKYSRKKLSYLLGMVAFFLGTYWVLKSTFLFKIFIVALAVSKIGIEKSFEIIFKLKLWVLLFVVTLSVVGIIPNSLVQVEKGIGTVYGYSLGFTHPNRLASAVCFLLLCYICWKNKQFNCRQLFIINVTALSVFGITGCRTIVYCILIYDFFFFCRKTRFTKKATESFLALFAIASVPLSIVVSISMPFLLLYSTGKVQKVAYDINLLFSRRFTHIEHIFLAYPVSFVGGQFDTDLMNELFGYSVVDNGYIRFLYYYGIIGLAIFCILSIISAFKLIKEKEYTWATVFIIVAVEGLLENIYIDFGLNLLVVFFAYVINIREKSK